MSYFSQEFIDFFAGLEANNRKEWFDENRKTYEKQVKEPFKAFVQKLIDAVSEREPEIALMPKDAIFRINRDIRFSKDKTPYKVHVSCAIAKGGKKAMFPGYYLQFNHKNVWLGGGLYNLDKDALKRVRSEIMYETKEFTDLVESAEFKSHFGELKGDKNKVLPAEFKEMKEEVPLIANKQFYFMTELDPELITSDKLMETVLEYFGEGYKINQFFKRALEVGEE